ncbi:hypothetical protein CCACVL1_15404 [Corchorus capsularis]|uniref:Uncharacterized protein n=1 Tax=Corchorus capsularis TaxID=210143 RepID=A0A1R3I2J7_COCAP|nr:hypothetical protein CCACVL1_15404 [Corchorus capsularis]
MGSENWAINVQQAEVHTNCNEPAREFNEDP